jgi:hypothetical protein
VRSIKSPRQYAQEAAQWGVLYKHALPRLRRLSKAPQFDNPSWRAELARELEILENANNQVLAFDAVPEQAKETHRAFKEFATHLHVFAVLMQQVLAGAKVDLVLEQAKGELQLALGTVYSLGIQIEVLAKWQ